MAAAHHYHASSSSLLWGAGGKSRSNAVALHTYKPGYWRERAGVAVLSYVETKVGGHVFDHLRMTCREPSSPLRAQRQSNNPQDDEAVALLWGDAGSSKRRFGGVPPSFWLGLQEAAAGAQGSGAMEMPPPPPPQPHPLPHLLPAPAPPSCPSSFVTTPPSSDGLQQPSSSYEMLMYDRYVRDLHRVAAAVVARPAVRSARPSSPPTASGLGGVKPIPLTEQAAAAATTPAPAPAPASIEAAAAADLHREPFPLRTAAAAAAVGGGVGAATMYGVSAARGSARKRAMATDAAAERGQGTAGEAATAGAADVSAQARWEARLKQAPEWSPLRRFRLVRSLGKGGHAETLLVAKDGEGQQQQLFVLKESELLPEAMNEARLLLQLQGQAHVVGLRDWWCEQLGHVHAAYLLLDYCDGGDLAALVKARAADRRPLSDRQVRAILRQVASGLAAMHARQIVHRDLKPENVLLASKKQEGGEEDDEDGSGWGWQVKLADLGVATRLTASLPLAHHVAGSVPYMAPEVRRFLLGEPVAYDEKADIFALGALAYALLTANPSPNLANVPPHNVVAEVARLRGWPTKAKASTSSSLAAAEAEEENDGGVAARLSSLLLQTLQAYPAKRPSAAEVARSLSQQVAVVKARL